MHSNPRAFRMNFNECKLRLSVAYVKFSDKHIEAALGVGRDDQGRASSSHRQPSPPQRHASLSRHRHASPNGHASPPRHRQASPNRHASPSCSSGSFSHPSRPAAHKDNILGDIDIVDMLEVRAVPFVKTRQTLPDRIVLYPCRRIMHESYKESQVKGGCFMLS